MTTDTKLPNLSGEQLKKLEVAIEGVKSVLEEFLDFSDKPVAKYAQNKTLGGLWDKAIGLWEEFEDLEDEVAIAERS